MCISLKKKKNSLWHSSKARISCIKPAYPILHYGKFAAYLECVLGYTHLIFLLMSSHLPNLCPHTSSTYPICVAPLSKKNRRLDYRPLSGKMNPPHIIRDSLSRGGIKIELGRAVEIVLKGITASGGSRNIL